MRAWRGCHALIFFVLLVHLDKCTPFVCVVALLVHLRQVHPLCVCCCFVGALLALASGKAERRQVHPLVCVGALLVHLRQVHPLYVRYCFVGALLALASGKAERRQVHP